MANEQTLEQPLPSTAAETEGAAPAAAPKRPSTANRKAGTGHSKAGKAEPATGKAKKRGYSDNERAEKLAAIEARTSGGETLKAAIKGAGISEQTYYQWKRAGAPVEEPKAKAEANAGLETLADLVALEEENQRLRIRLAEKLRAENVELRKRLGLD
ncbi:transposase [Sinorhizobium fredii]|uniref:Transcriptional regulator SyrB protein n=1 Tax=Rhizobium fredii TaxID=380 RepID=A0A2L0HCS1_RHIFR|nr:transposase [Sinorhizobium fredii]AUX79300.1 transcriptional regulator SyrB protein [Sinorhizobium fredii]